MQEGAIRISLLASDNTSRYTTWQHKRAFPVQGILHCYSIFGAERVARIYAHDVPHLKEVARRTARRLFGKA